MIELLVVAGLFALALLSVVAVLVVLRQRREGTVRAVFVPRREGDDWPTRGA